MANSSEDRRNTALRVMTMSLRIIDPYDPVAAERADLAAYQGPNAFRDRLTRSDQRVEGPRP